jgi:hypothetical protein
MINRMMIVLALTFVACEGGDGDDDAGRIGTDGSVDAGGRDTDGGMDDAGRDTDGGMDDAGRDTDGGMDDGGSDGGTDAGTNIASAQITAVLAAPAGPADLPIEGALVTYVRPLIGTDPAGLFLQAEREGPAVFVAVDPASLTPAAAVGQRVSLRATDLSDASVPPRRHEVLAITGWTVVSSGNDVSTLVQDVGSVDLVTMLDAYASELIETEFEIRGIYRAAGTGYSLIPIDTPGLSGSDALGLRVPSSIITALDLELGCTYLVSGAPLWRNDGVAQVSVFDPSEVMTVVCEPPVPSIADSLNQRTIVVRFSRVLDMASVMASGAQFTVEHSSGSSVAVTAAAVRGMYAVVTTGADLLPGQFYTVRVASSVRDTGGMGVPAAMSSLMIEGYTPHLVINEIDYDQPGSDAREFVELHNPGLTALPLTGLTFYVLDIDTTTHTTSVRGMVALVPNSAAVTELAPGGFMIVRSSNSIALLVPGGVPTVMTSVAFQNDEEGVAVSAAGACHDIVFYEGVPTAPATIAECAFQGSAGTDPADGALGRMPNGSDFDEASIDYVVLATSPGAPNGG